MSFFSITVEINAPASEVWSVVCDIDQWPEWTPTVRSIERLDNLPIGPGARFRIRQPKFPPADWTVTVVEDGRSITCQTQAPGISVTAHHYVEPAPPGAKATLSIRFSGPLGPLIARLTAT